MFAHSTGPRSAARRRGIVLVLVLGMLGLMALIGVTFATFAGQSLKSGRNFSQGVARPQPEALMDYALAQLINDTNNPLSAIRGHSLLRDMYGNDSLFRGSNPPGNSVAETGGLLSQVYDSTIPGNTTCHFTGYNKNNNGTLIQYITSIPATGQYSGYDFTRWTIRFAPNSTSIPSVPQTFEVISDTISGGYHAFTLAANLVATKPDPNSSITDASSSDSTAFIYFNPNLGATGAGTSFNKGHTALAREFTSPFTSPFTLDGRYMRAFNGPGLTRPVQAVQNHDASGNPIVNYNYPYNQAAYGNMRLANSDPDLIGMDEDYDACDLENWYLAIQSADGQVMIPSFHRPGILTALDWTVPASDSSGNLIPYNLPARAKILRPRQIDNSPLFPADPSVVDSTTGKLTYDIDNDGDGVTDSVWLDLGYPVQRDPTGKLYKPLFAFMVLGLNGRLPLNTVGNLQARAIGYHDPNDTTYAASAGQVPYAGTNNFYSSHTYFDAPLYDHTSHLGYSVNEINPKFALQNAPSNLYASPNYSQTALGGHTDYTNPVSYSQLDDAGVPVALTQLRNILAGTIPTSFANPYTGTLPVSTSAGAASSANFDMNIVYVNGQPYVLPNSVADGNDYAPGVGYVARSASTVPGRWGEPEGIPSQIPFAGQFLDSEPNFPMLRYTNPVRAGRSIFGVSSAGSSSNDAIDDDFDSFDPWLPYSSETPTGGFQVVKNTTGTLTQDTLPVNSLVGSFLPTAFKRTIPENVDRFDLAGQMAVASERIRRYVTPQDPAGVGRMVSFTTRPFRDYDYGLGFDVHGRSSYFRYFRPAGMPQQVFYPYVDSSTGFGFLYNTSNRLGQQFLAPILVPAGHSDPSGTPTSTEDVFNNTLHGYQSMLTPDTQVVSGDNANFNNTTDSVYTAQEVARMAAMPYDHDPETGTTPAGYLGAPNPVTGVAIPLFTPTINPTPLVNGPLLSNVNSETGPNLGAVGASTAYPIPYVPAADGTNSTATGSSGYTSNVPNYPMVVNGYIGGSLNKDEADEMNLYVANSHDMPYGPTDLEWLYRKQDVDGATLNSRLAQLAPISFLNPADGLTRRRMFSTDAWDLINFSYANDNPIPYPGIVGFTTPYSRHSGDHDFTYNSRFMPDASPSLQVMNQVPSITPTTPSYVAAPPYYDDQAQFNHNANPITTEFLANPTSTLVSFPTAISSQTQNTSTTPPTSLYNMYSAAATNAATVQTPTVAHRDRKINLNFPLPISNDPAEPIRQKWCRETYRMLKAILPPASVDTPEELAALSQFVVNIIDFRDTDCTTTRFVNTDLVVTDALTKTHPVVPLPSPTTNFDISPTGVRFPNPSVNSLEAIPYGNFPYDPSLYSPDAATPFLVQHGMEYSPVAINEVFAMQYKCNGATGSTIVKGDNALSGTTRGLFIEMVNTLTEAQNNSIDGSSRPSATNSSVVDLTGWDLIITPDDYGWGRPDPITGEVSQVAWPPLVTGAGSTFVDPPVYQGTGSANTALPPGTTVQQYRFNAVAGNNSGSTNKVKAINGTRVRDFYIAGGYTYSATPPAPPVSPNPPSAANAGQPWPLGGSAATTVAANSSVESSPIAVNTTANAPTNDANDRGTTANPATTYPTLDVVLPQSFIPYSTAVTAGLGKGAYFWVYLRRPANPFDTADLTTTRPNREMVVVDAMRFAFDDLGATPSITNDVPGTPVSSDIAFSAQRLQPYRGGHLVPKDTPPANLASGKICPPTPAAAYGYSEQTVPPNQPAALQADYVRYVNTNGVAITSPNLYSKPFYETIGRANDLTDTNWAPFAFHDRDFASVAELLLVPSCPPGLFTKQFVEEPYPGHASGFTITNGGTPTSLTTTAATGWDSRKLNGTAVPAEPELGRVNFGYGATLTAPPAPTYPYLTDNFYYTAASVAPPLNTSLSAMYTHLTTEVGGWTGTGWHKMFEFFEVPSSANGAIGTTDVGNNYDWARNDLKPGQINLNLLIDEEVFAGLIDDPRLNENLAVATTTTTLPSIVSQIDVNGYPALLASGNFARYPIFSGSSVNIPVGSAQAGRGYVIHDPNSADYTVAGAYQQVHGLKAAFSDFLKLRHGGSGHLFAHGAGDVGMGDYILQPLNTTTTQPVAADRPYRSLSYPDVNYTIMRPSSLPPSPSDNVNATPHYPGTTPLLTLFDTYLNHVLSGGLFVYGTNAAAPYLSLDPPSTSIPYIQDPGIRNPFLDIQYNTTTNNTLQVPPPYDVTPYNIAGPVLAGTPPAPAPFPPTIPPTPARRLFQIPDYDMKSLSTPIYPSSNASLITQQDSNQNYMVNEPVITPQLWTSTTTPPTLVPNLRAVFMPDNYTPQAAAVGDSTHANNHLGEGPFGTAPASPNFDLRQHPVYRTEMLQKISNLTTVRTHQFATWITVGFFEVVKTGTPELGIPDVLGQELGIGAGKNVRYRSFFVLDRTKATGFNPYYPGNFRDCVTYRRRIE